MEKSKRQKRFSENVQMSSTSVRFHTLVHLYSGTPCRYDHNPSYPPHKLPGERFDCLIFGPFRFDSKEDATVAEVLPRLLPMDTTSTAAKL
jgi:hypothetical protein